VVQFHSPLKNRGGHRRASVEKPTDRATHVSRTYGSQFFKKEILKMICKLRASVEAFPLSKLRDIPEWVSARFRAGRGDEELFDWVVKHDDGSVHLLSEADFMERYEQAADKPKLIYLAGPYSDTQSAVMNERFIALTKKCGELIADGLHVFSPITHGHWINRYSSFGASWKIWEKFDLFMLKKSDELFVYCLSGWEQSVGVQAEIKFAQEHNKKIVYIEE
jgi:hypothetical protein